VTVDFEGQKIKGQGQSLYCIKTADDAVLQVLITCKFNLLHLIEVALV